MLSRGLLRGVRACSARMSLPAAGTPHGVRAMSTTHVMLADKRMNVRQHRVRKEETKKREEVEGFDEDEAIEALVEDSRVLDMELDGILKKYESSCRHLITMSKGGTSGIETLQIDGKPLTSYASVSTQGLNATINVFHQVNVLKVKSALSQMDSSLAPKMGLTPTSLVVLLPRMTRDKRESLISRAREKLEALRRETHQTTKQLLTTHRKELQLIHPSRASQFSSEAHQAEKDCNKAMQEVFESTQEAILPPQQ